MASPSHFQVWSGLERVGELGVHEAPCLHGIGISTTLLISPPKITNYAEQMAQKQPQATWIVLITLSSPLPSWFSSVYKTQKKNSPGCTLTSAMSHLLCLNADFCCSHWLQGAGFILSASDIINRYHETALFMFFNAKGSLLLFSSCRLPP